MRPKKIDIDVADESTTGFDTGLTGAGPFTPTVTTPTDGLAHQVSITSAANISAITLTLTGTDADGKTQTEAVTGPNATTVESTKYFKTLTSITASATLGANTMDVGWVDEVASQTIPLDFYANNPATVQVDVTGTLNFDIEVTNGDIFVAATSYTDQSALPWLNDGNFTAKTADLIDDLAVAGVKAMRIVLNSYSSGAELQAYITQSR